MDMSTVSFISSISSLYDSSVISTVNSLTRLGLVGVGIPLSSDYSGPSRSTLTLCDKFFGYSK